ncbi:MAG: hypothetical protein M1155_01465 [Patescibacteria group bacterium]|nr:hypothetical protein [Patescibacteria group bacterium]
MNNIVSRLVLSIFAPKTPEKRSLSIHQEHELLMKLEKAGLLPQDAQRVIDSKGNAVAEEMLYVLRNGVFEPTKSQKAAKEIMGNNFFGIEDAIEHFKLRPTRSEIATLQDVPFSEATLRACKDTHVLVAVFSLSILEMLSNKMLQPLFSVGDTEKAPWFKKEKFFWKEGEVRWCLIRKNPEDDSFNEEWVDQLSRFGMHSDPARVRMAVYAALGHFLKTGERMFAEGMARCAELDESGRRITVGPFKEDGLRIQAWWDDSRAYFVGAASAHKEE